MTGISCTDLVEALERIATQARTEAQERRQLVDLLRDHVMDWGWCSHPADCDCSDARARRFLAEHEGPTWLQAKL